MDNNFIKKLKYSRLSAEEKFMVDIFNGIQIYPSKKFTDTTLFVKNDKILFKYVSEGNRYRIYCNYNYVWSNLVNLVNFNYDNMSDFIKKWFNKNYKANANIILVDYWFEY
jgi:hypothetical protein